MPTYYSQTPSISGTPRTPTRHLPRSELGRVSQSNQIYARTPTGSVAGSSPPSSPPDNGNAGNHYEAEDDFHQAGGTVIWGTSINIATCSAVFREFLNNYTQASDFEPYYLRQFSTLHRTEQSVLNLNCTHLAEYMGTRRFYKQLVMYPSGMLPIIDMVVREEYEKQHGVSQTQIIVRTYGLTVCERMRDLEPGHIDQLLKIKGMVIRCSQVIPELKQAFFRCFVCQESTDVVIDRGQIDVRSNIFSKEVCDVKYNMYNYLCRNHPCV